jgi:hypothetical protein
MSAALTIPQRRLNALDQVDKMPAGLRECVHEFGLPIVTVLTKFGIRDARHIREIVKEIWAGPRQDGQGNHVLNTIDVLLSRGPVSALALRRLLVENSHVIVTMEPTRAMLDASMAEVSGHNVVCTREEKHRRRLRAALRAAAAEQERRK